MSNNQNQTQSMNNQQAASNAINANASTKLEALFGQSKDAQTIVSVLRDMGVDDFEPRVVNQLLELSYKYATNLLEDARAFSMHASKKTIDSEDIKMAIRSKVDYSFTTTAPRDLLLDISKTKNKNPLPAIKYHSGIRLPPDRFCLHATNYALKAHEPGPLTPAGAASPQHIASSPNQTMQTGNREDLAAFNHQPTSAQQQQLQQLSQVQQVQSFTSSAIKRPRAADEEDYDAM